MKSTLTTLKNSAFQLILLLAVVTLLGFLLFKYFQPLCEPCLPNTYCPPCRSKEQYVVQYIVGTIDVVILVRIFYLLIKRK